MTGWNLPPGCTDRDIDEAAGAYDEPPPPTEAEQLAEALQYAESVIATAETLLVQGRDRWARVLLRSYRQRREARS